MSMCDFDDMKDCAVQGHLNCSTCDNRDHPRTCHDVDYTCRKCRESAVDKSNEIVARLDAELTAQREAAKTDKGNWFRTGYMFGIQKAMEICAAPITEREGVQG